ncbi:hypothetical protein chiPu_0025652 [Chiloscyllium punctatum]|uniref:Uncharacterized protein n=1 Tax=Chiloscyllium punctatum TaxID=137246 RepID=A0A401TG66_CHIPU|nr:hypothetical protein [Chiloscyllium punctatum]
MTGCGAQSVGVTGRGAQGVGQRARCVARLEHELLSLCQSGTPFGISLPDSVVHSLMMVSGAPLQYATKLCSSKFFAITVIRCRAEEKGNCRRIPIPDRNRQTWDREREKRKHFSSLGEGGREKHRERER